MIDAEKDRTALVVKQPQTKIANHARYTFWYVVPTLPLRWIGIQLPP
jgi:hypothetical protein